MAHLVVAGVSVCLMAGCVAYDPRVRDYGPSAAALDKLTGTFVNKPSYRSKRAGFLGPDNFGEAVGAYPDRPEYIILRFKPDDGLNVQLVTGDETIFEHTYEPAELEIIDQGLSLPRQHMAGSDDSPVVGYGANRYTLRVDREDNLVVIQSGGGVGFVGILPVVIYAKLMAVYPRAPVSH